MLTGQSPEPASDSISPSLSVPPLSSLSLSLSLSKISKNKNFLNIIQRNYKESFRGSWVAQLVERPTSTQVMISRSVGSSPASGSVLTAQGLEPALDSVSSSLSATTPLTPAPSTLT